MKLKVDVRNLRIGMYVSDLDRPWRETSFLFQGFRIQSQADIEEIGRFCEYVFVKIEEPEQNVREKRVEFEILRASAPARQPREPVYVDRATLEEELEPARSGFANAQSLVHALMHDARLGKSLDGEGVKRTVTNVLASILRNPDAMMCLSQIKKRHEYTAAHCLRVCILALAFGRHLGMTEAELNVLGIGALLHDIGKARVSEALLDKPGALSATEFDLVKQHVPLGVRLVEGLAGIPRPSIEIVAQHHERHDGSGYMRGLKGTEIDRMGMIAAMVDYYDALTSDRAYRDAISAHTVLKTMYVERGGLFQADLTEKFIQCIGVYPIGSLVELNTGHVGVVVTRNRQRSLRPRILLVLDEAKTAYPFPHYVDLAKQPRNAAGTAWEIRGVLEPGTYGLRPTDYMPVHPHHSFGALR